MSKEISQSYIMQILRDVYAVENKSIDWQEKTPTDGMLECKRKIIEKFTLEQQKLDQQNADVYLQTQNNFKTKDFGDGSIILKITQCNEQQVNDKNQIYEFLDEKIQNNDLSYVQNLTSEEEKLIRSISDEEQKQEKVEVVFEKKEDELEILQKSQSSVREQLQQLKQSNNKTPVLLENNIKQYVKEESSEPSVEKQILEYSGSNVASDKLFSL